MRNNFNFFCFGKKAQVSDVMVWIVASIIIFLVIGVTVYLAIFVFSLDSGLGSRTAVSVLGQKNLLVEKSFYGYLFTPVESSASEISVNVEGENTNSESGKLVYSQIKYAGDLDSTTGELGKRVLLGLHGDDVLILWMGVLNTGSVAENDYFGLRSTKGVAEITAGSSMEIYDYVKDFEIENDKKIELFTLGGN